MQFGPGGNHPPSALKIAAAFQFKLSNRLSKFNPPRPAGAPSSKPASSRAGNVKNDDPGLLTEDPATPEEMPLFQRSR